VRFLSLVATLAFVCGIVAADDAATKVVFVCEHGNVKSLMAASYFNQLAAQRGLPFHAVSRGVAPDSTTVPEAIVAGLHTDGFDVGDFHPSKVTTTDVADAVRTVAISTELPASVRVAEHGIERWTDVPPASSDYDAARTSLKAHVSALLDRLSTAVPK
jgi:protein-tyrosine-phosphatase